ncbi:MAG: hypothetical protein OXH84_07880 [Gammaproteobacteria bacterium]|nr:hypothetical protein [Gammaproteobacteria bacterium]
MNQLRWIFLALTTALFGVSSLLADYTPPTEELPSSQDSEISIEHQRNDGKERITIAFLSEVLLSDVPDLLHESIAFLEDSAEDWFSTIEVQINLIVKSYDTDGDGGLSDQELLNIVLTKELGPRNGDTYENHGEIDEFLQDKDADSDGRMSVDELIEFFDITLADSVDEFGEVLSSFDTVLELGPFPEKESVDLPAEEPREDISPEADL